MVFCYHRATGILRKLAPACSPSTFTFTYTQRRIKGTGKYGNFWRVKMYLFHYTFLCFMKLKGNRIS